MKNVLLSLDEFSDRRFARASRCLAIQMCEEPSSEQLAVSQQHIPQDQERWISSQTGNLSSIIASCVTFFPILCSFDRSKMFCNSSFSWMPCRLQKPGSSLCLTWLSWLQDAHRHYFRMMLLWPKRPEGCVWREVGSELTLTRELFSLFPSTFWELKINAQFILTPVYLE